MRKDPAEAAVALLGEHVHGCVAQPRGERDGLQEAIAGKVLEALRAVEAARSAAVAELEVKVGSAEGEKAARADRAEKASEDLAAKSVFAEGVKAALQKASAEAAEARDALTAAEDAQKAHEASQLEVVEKRARLEAFVGGELAMLKEGTAAGTAKHIKALTKLGQDFGLDAELMSAAASTFAKPAAERGTFDGLVQTELDALIAACAADLAAVAADAEPQRAKCAARLKEAGEAWVKCLETENARRVEADAASKAVKDAEVARKEAARAAKDFGPEMKQAAAALAHAKSAAEECQGVLSAYGELVDRAAPEAEAVPVDAV